MLLNNLKHVIINLWFVNFDLSYHTFKDKSQIKLKMLTNMKKFTKIKQEITKILNSLKKQKMGNDILNTTLCKNFCIYFKHLKF